MFYPKSDRSQEPVPGSIEHIIFEPNGKVTFTIQHQLPALPGFVDPYVEWPHFPACVYSMCKGTFGCHSFGLNM
jgi:hypothetical protein